MKLWSILSLFLLPLLAASFANAQPSAASAGVSAGQASESYVIVPLDVVSFRIIGEIETASEARVAADGTVSFPYVGTVKLSGMTVANARKYLFDLYNADFYVNPQVDLAVIGYKQRRVQVQGMVNQQGFVMFPPEEQLYLLGAISLAGGWRQDRFADQGRVELRRTQPDGSVKSEMIDTRKITQSDYPLQDGDYIYVHERRI